MSTHAALGAEKLHLLLGYDPATCNLTWKARSPDLFENGKQTSEHTCNRWNSRYAGKPALDSYTAMGYKQGCIFNKKYLAHRVIYAMCHGDWPANQIDHIDGDPSNNRIENLRDVSHAENQRNMRAPTNNTSGTVGVHWSERDQTWGAQIEINRRKIHLGCFTKKDDALLARANANIKYDFHENHGRDSNV